MNIALIGYGKMGHAVEAIALERGHCIACTFDSAPDLAAHRDLLAQADLAIEFTQPTEAPANLQLCLDMGIPTVCGTTGWYATHYEAIATLYRQRGGRLLTATYFSLGMNIMFALNEHLATLMAGRTTYKASITETHHIHKLDAPSGTALTLQEQIHSYGNRDASEIPIRSIREGEVAGIHTVSYTSPEDTLTLTHQAHSRRGLALGAVVAAEWLFEAAPGVYTLQDLLR